MNVSDVEYTAGLGGFLVLFGLGLMLWFLGRDLSRRLRRLRQQEELRLRNTPREQPTKSNDGPSAHAASEASEEDHGTAHVDDGPEGPTRSQG